MSDFEIYAAPLTGESDTAWERRIAGDVAAILGAPSPVRGAGEFSHIGIEEAAVNVMLLPPGGEWVWPVFEAHPLLLDIRFRAEHPEWKSPEDFARYVFHRLDGLSKYELLLVHDLEEYVESNFDFPEQMDMLVYRRPGQEADQE
ncbi:hypothetical protein ACFZAE_16030 [Streptomyces scabiei]|uniref:hypothetical protein n=1 Tax=Streptomyces TaxID=1883 RepID=UPI001BFF1A21|nr:MULTISPECIES: hypothetical protein [unclassified Streptomyces]